MRDKFLFSDAQVFTNSDTTGAISSNVWDLEEDSVTDQMIEGCLMVKIIAATLSGLTEGLIVGLRLDDAANLATAQNGTSAGYKDIAMKHILKEEIVAGKVFAIPFLEIKTARSKYLGAWAKAVNTANTGTVTLEMYYSERPDDAIKNVQKKPS